VPPAGPADQGWAVVVPVVARPDAASAAVSPGEVEAVVTAGGPGAARQRRGFGVGLADAGEPHNADPAGGDAISRSWNRPS
jgi:hypothetical protein